MPPRKPASSANRARLTVLAASDPKAFLALATELMRSKQRLHREAGLEALAEHPVPEAREALRAMYFELDEDGGKRDQEGVLRSTVIQTLKAIGDPRDIDIAMRACDTFEKILGQDVTWALRVYGLRMVAEITPALLPYLAAEALHPRDPNARWEEPANTALQLLAGLNAQPQAYQWLISGERTPAIIAPALELLLDAPPEIVERYLARAVDVAVRTADDALAIVAVEAVVEREMERLYPSIDDLMRAKISDELYSYLAMLLATTNRAPLLSILDQQLRRGRPKLIEAALRVRTTPEQEAMLKRWEDGE